MPTNQQKALSKSFKADPYTVKNTLKILDQEDFISITQVRRKLLQINFEKFWIDTGKNIN